MSPKYYCSETVPDRYQSRAFKSIWYFLQTFFCPINHFPDSFPQLTLFHFQYFRTTILIGTSYFLPGTSPL
jgi:hypothetical protein